MKISIIDLGTNSIRFMVFGVSASGKARRLYHEKIFVRLGENLFTTRKLDKAARKRTLEAFGKFRRYVDDNRVNLVRIVATSALREARDRRKFIKTVKKETGFNIELIEGRHEARLIAIGIIDNLALPKEPLLMIDLGGGSTELNFCLGTEIEYSLSLPVGAARCQELILKTVPPILTDQEDGEAALRRHIRELLDERRRHFPFQTARFTVGSSGSIRAFSRIHAAATGGGETFPTQFISDSVNKMKKMSRGELLKIPSLKPKRVDLIVSAGIILHELLTAFQAEEMLTTAYALKEGLVVDLIHRLHIRAT